MLLVEGLESGSLVDQFEVGVLQVASLFEIAKCSLL